MNDTKMKTPARAWTALVWCALFALATAPAARAQGTRRDDIVLNPLGHPVGGAMVRVCTATATGQPCTPLANIYSDLALTQPMANPLTTDGLGNYFFTRRRAGTKLKSRARA